MSLLFVCLHFFTFDRANERHQIDVKAEWLSSVCNMQLVSSRLF